MCYSTMIEANFKNLEERFDAFMDWSSVKDAFVLRDKYKSARIPAAIDTYLIQSAKTSDQKKLAKMALSYYESEIEKLSTKKEKYENDCLVFEEKIKKGSKAKDLNLKLEKRRQSVLNLKKQIEHYSSIKETGAPRVFPNFYAPVIILEKNKKIIQLMRYHILPASGKELLPFKYNLFNARKDKLIGSRIWKPLFGQKHGIYPFFRFYESVDDGNGGSQSIYFEPDSNELMWSAALFENCKIKEGLLRSHAAITDNPPPEVAEAGHDRCPVFLQEDKINLWLNPKNQSPEELLSLLDQVTSTYFEHSLVA